MRILISTRKGAGHFGPLLPFARALLRANDEVLVAAPSSAAPMIAAAGLDHYPIPDPPEEKRAAIFASTAGLSMHDRNARIARDVFIGIDARAAYPHVLDAVESWSPDLVLFEESENAAPLAAETAGVPAVCVGISLRAVGNDFKPVIASAIDELRADLGLAPDPGLARFLETPFFTLTQPSFEHPDVPGPDDALRFREADDHAPRPLPAWWRDNRRPLVYVTFGSVAPTTDFFPSGYRTTLEALSELPVRVLMTIGRDRDPAELGPVSPNVHVARWVPQADVMPHAAAIVCHGGHGTVRAGLAAGVPMAVLPLFADQHYNARRVDEIGAGIALDDGPEALDALPEAVQRLLAEPSFRQAARQIAAETRRLPTVDSAAAILRQLALAAYA
jgi:UDP:flavonoid glycosyltransferase YjiC (YdhE family)